MRYYVQWSLIQERLKQWAQEHGKSIQFPRAVSLLWQEGQVCQGMRLPQVEFDHRSWQDPDRLHQRLDAIPVDVTMFLEADFCAQGPSDAMRRDLNVRPIKIAAYQGQFLHAHRNYELLYLLRGNGGLRTQRGTVDCPEGTLCLVDPGMVHDVFAEPDSDAVSLAFTEESMNSILQKLLKYENVMSEFFHNSLAPQHQGYVLLQLSPDDRIRWLVGNIFVEGYSGEEYADELCADYIELLFSYALRACSNVPKTCSSREKQPKVPIAAVMKYIQVHYRTTSLKEVAAIFHYDADYLGRQIKRHMGVNYMELVLQLKLKEVKRLLRETGLTMEEIAERTGMGSAVHLSRTFKKRFGVPPSQYSGE